jgi:superfamily I DNA and/or RNA helicase
MTCVSFRVFTTFKTNDLSQKVTNSSAKNTDIIFFLEITTIANNKIKITQNLGFITDEHQTNVALTRARKGLIVVGEF